MGEFVDMILIIISGVVIIWALLKGVKNTEKAENLKKVPTDRADVARYIKEASMRYGVPERYVNAVAWKENAFTMQPDGGAGEKGIMQLKPIAVKDLMLEKYDEREFRNWRTDARDNIFAGTAFLHLMKKRHGTWFEAFRAYNQGGTGKDQDADKKALADAYARDIIEKAKFF